MKKNYSKNIGNYTSEKFFESSKYTVVKKEIFLALLFIVLLLNCFKIQAQSSQDVQIPSGSLIVNMGVIPQTVNNGLKPYGLVYALLNMGCPVHWVIKSTKSKDGTDFTYNGVDYKGGTFVVDAKYRTVEVNALIATWTNPNGIYKVVGVTTNSPVTVPVYLTFYSAPRWTMDLQNGSIAAAFFVNAGIPVSAYGQTKTPALLDCCDDVFVMPHADPKWSTHGHIWNWVTGSGGCKGGVWTGCHAGSALSDMFDNTTLDGDPIDFNQQTNLLSDKSGPAVGVGPYSENALILWGNHNGGTPPYSYDYSGEPIMQFMGSTYAAQQNGSEQLYIPKSAGWFANTHVGAYDPKHPQRYLLSDEIKYRAAAIVYGPAFGIEGNGKIMFEGGHNVSGTAPANVAAQRAFLNYSFLVAWEKTVTPKMAGLPSIINSGTSTSLSYSIVPNVPPAPVSSYRASWTSSCGGTFSVNNDAGNQTTYTAPKVSTPTLCNISVTITDDCGRKTFDVQQVTIMPCTLGIEKNVIPVPCNGQSNGAINLSINGGAEPYAWSWNRTSIPTASGSGSSANSNFSIDNLVAGTYSVTVDDANTCKTAFTVQVSQPSLLTVETTVGNVSCFGASTGSVDLTVKGGTGTYSYTWNNGATSEDLVNIAAGTYTVTVTDFKGCTATASAKVEQPTSGLSLSEVITDNDCKGSKNGAINITAAGGTGSYSYDWTDIAGTDNMEDRTALAAGSYEVTVSEANGCSVTKSFTISEPEKILVTGALTQPTCPPTIAGLGSNGAIRLTVSGGTNSYSYAWSSSNGGIIPPDQATIRDLTGLVPGIYTVHVTDSNGCVTEASFTLINQSPSPVQPSSINH